MDAFDNKVFFHISHPVRLSIFYAENTGILWVIITSIES